MFAPKLLLAPLLALPAGAVEVLKPLVTGPGDTVSFTYTVVNPNAEQFTQAQLAPLAAPGLVVLGTSDLGPYDIPPGGQRAFRLDLAIAPGVPDGGYAAAAFPVFKPVNTAPSQGAAAGVGLFFVDRASPTAVLAFTPSPQPDGTQPPDFPFTLSGEFPSSPVALSTPPALDATRFVLTLRDEVSGLKEASITEDGVLVSSFPDAGFAAVSATVTLRDGALYVLRAKDNAGNETVGQFYADSALPKAGVTVRAEPQNPTSFQGTTLHTVYVHATDSVWLRDLKLARAADVDFAHLSGSSWDAVPTLDPIPFPPGVTSLPPGTKSFDFAFPGLADGGYVVLAIDAAGKLSQPAVLSFFEEDRQISLLEPGAGSADCHRALKYEQGAWRITNPGRLGTASASAPLSASANAGSVTSTWLKGVTAVLAPPPGGTQPRTFELSGTALELPEGGRLSLSANAKPPLNPLLATAGQTFDEAVAPAAPGALLRGAQARLYATLENPLTASTSPAVSRLSALVQDHVVKIVQSGAPDPAQGRYALAPGVGVHVQAQAASGATVDLVVDRVTAPGEAAVIDIPFNPDAQNCPFTPALAAGPGAFDLLLTAADATSVDLTVALSGAACASPRDTQLVHIDGAGQAENAVVAVNRSACTLRARARSASPFYALLPAGADGVPPTTGVSSSWTVRDATGLAVVGPTTALPLAGTDAGGEVPLTEYRRPGGVFQSLETPLGGATSGLEAVEMRSRDASGNLEVAKSTVVHLDADAPTVSFAVPAYTSSLRPNLSSTLTDSLAALATGSFSLLLDGQPLAFSPLLQGSGPSGLIDSWQSAPSLPNPLFSLGATLLGNRLFTVGGRTTSFGSRTDVSTTLLGSDSVPGTWASALSLPQGRFDLVAVAASGWLYAIGGTLDGSGLATNTVYFSKPADNGSIPQWFTSTLPGSFAAMVAVSYAATSADIYAVGGKDASGNPVSTVFAARPDPATGFPGAWTTTAPLPEPLGEAAAAVAGGRLYVVGGTPSSFGVSEKVYSAQIGEQSLSGWRPERSLPPGAGARRARAVAFGGRLYFLGGATVSYAPLNTVYSAQVNPDGTLGAWEPGPPLPKALHSFGAAAGPSAIYTMGGTDGVSALADVYYAKPAASGPTYSARLDAVPAGSLSEAVHTLSAGGSDRVLNAGSASTSFIVDVTPPSLSLSADGLPLSSSTARDLRSGSPGLAASYSDGVSGIDAASVKVFLDGADATSAASVSDMGALYAPPAPLSEGVHSLLVRVDDRAGNRASLSASFRVDTIAPSVVLSSPAAGAFFKTGSVDLAASASDQGSGLDPAAFNLLLNGATVYAPASFGGNGGLSLWSPGPAMPFPVAFHTLSHLDGYLYSMGGHDGVPKPDGSEVHADVYYSALGADGAPGPWLATTPLPQRLDRHTAITADGRLYAIGGSRTGTAAVNTVYFSKPSAGVIPSWSASAMPPSLWGLDAVGVAIDSNGLYLFVLGGQDGGGAPHAEVFVSPLDRTSGSPGTWSQTTSLPLPLGGVQAVEQGGRIYVLGGVSGYNTSDAVARVYSGVVGSGGTVASWRPETDLPEPLAYGQAAVVGRRVYYMGGQRPDGSVSAAVRSCPINPDGTLGAWRDEASFTRGRFDFASAASPTALYASGGVVPNPMAMTDEFFWAKPAAEGLAMATATVTGLTQGAYEVRARAADLAGNTAFSSAAFFVDMTGPVASLEVMGASVTANGVVTAQSGTPVRVLGSDLPLGAASGVAALWLAVDGGAAQAGPGPFNLTDGYHNLSFWGTDALGNQGSTNTLIVRLDTGTAVAVAVDGSATLTAPTPVAISTVAPQDAPGIYQLAADNQGLTSVLPVYYDLDGGIFTPDAPAVLSFYFDPTLVADLNLLGIYTFDGTGWVRDPISNQRYTLLSDHLAVFTGELAHASAYALMLRSNHDITPPAVAFTFPRPEEPGLCRLAQGRVTVRGTVSDENIASWRLEEGSVLLGSGTANAAGTLGFWDAAGKTGPSTLALSARDSFANAGSASLTLQAGSPIRTLALGGEKRLNKPRGVAVGTNRVYVADTNGGAVRVFDLAGNLITSFGSAKGAGKLNKPVGVALDAAGNVWVADSANKRVAKYSAAGSFLAEFGKGQLERPMAVVALPGKVLVADAKAGQVVVFSDAGTLLSRVALPPATRGSEEGDDEEEPRPTALAVDAAGNLWVADAKGGRVLRYTAGLALAQTIPGFERPEGVAVSPSGACLAVVDSKTERVRTFDAALGAELAGFGKESLHKPAQAAFTPDGQLFVANRNDDMVTGFGLPGTPVVLALATPGKSGGARLSAADSSAVEAVVARVGAVEGGAVEQGDGTKVEIPAGAVNADQDVSVAKAADSGDDFRLREAAWGASGLAAASSAREFGPHGLTFSEPALITLPYDPSLVASVQDLKVHYWNAERGSWEALDSVVDEAAHTVSARVAHFSLYQALAPARSITVMADPEATFGLRQVYAFPNPAVGGQKPTVHVAVGRADKVTIRIYDIAGSPVHEATVDSPATVNDETGPHLAYEHTWDGHIPSGVYIYTVTAEKAGNAPIKCVGKLAVVR